MARATGRSLIGIPVEHAIGAVPDQWVKERGIYWLRRWLTLADDAEHAELMVLTACRIWHFDTEGTHCSKPAAGEWALDRDPSLTGVRLALRQRQGRADESIPAEAVAQVLRNALDHVTTRP
ncbi:aminoglycoside adenylyltransferase domain-containing protein [Flexivirga lutea]